MADFEKKGYDTIVFGLTDKGYEILSINMSKIQQMVRQQKAKIEAYEEYYKEQNSALDNMQVEQDEKIKEMETKNKNTRTWADRIFKNPFGSDK